MRKRRKTNRFKLWLRRVLRFVSNIFVGIYNKARNFIQILYVKEFSKQLVNHLKAGKPISYTLLILSPEAFGKVLQSKWVVIESHAWMAQWPDKKDLGIKTKVVFATSLSDRGMDYLGGHKPGGIRCSGTITHIQRGGYGEMMSYTNTSIRLAAPEEYAGLVTT